MPGEQPPNFDRLLASQFSLDRLFAAAQPDHVTKAKLFVEGLTASELQTALAQVDEVRAAHEETLRSRQTLQQHKWSEANRKKLRAAAGSAEQRARELVRALPLRDEWVARLVSRFRRAGEEVEQARAGLNELERKHGIPMRDLRRQLRETRGDDNAARKLAHRMGLAAQDVQQLDQDVRALGRRIQRQQQELEMPADEVVKLAAVAREWEVLRPKSTGRARLAHARDSGRAPVSLDLQALQARAAELAAGAIVLTDIPRPRRSGVAAQRRGGRRVEFVSAEGSAGPVAEQNGATYADLGRVGEGVVFSLMRARWESAVRASPLRTAELLRAAVEYWDPASERLAAARAVLQGAPEQWFSSDLVRDILWPARTLYGDAMGFDLFGLSSDGAELLCVEVKTTLGPPSTNFELTANELDRARREGSRYVLARVASLNAASPAVYLWHDPVALIESGTLRLSPSAYTVSFA